MRMTDWERHEAIDRAADRMEDLEAENERLRTENDQISDDVELLVDERNNLTLKLATANNELEEARKDGERLDALASRNWTWHFSPGGAHRHGDKIGLKPKPIRAAIDAAMEGEGEEDDA